MFLSRIVRLLLPAVLVLLAAAPSAASAAEVLALDLPPYLRESRWHALEGREYSQPFTSRATGTLTRIVVPVERPYWLSVGPGDLYEPIEVSVHALGDDGRFTGPALAYDQIQPEEVPSEPDGEYGGYFGGTADAVFTEGLQLVAGQRYAVRIRTTSLWDYVAGGNDANNEGVTWARSATGLNSWWPSVEIALRIYVNAQDAPPADVTAPTATISAPADGGVFALGAPLTAAFACADEGGSGLASCDGTVDGAPLASGGALPTGTVGFHDVAVAAADGAGNRGSASARYQVVWPFAGFYAPVNNLPTVNVVQAGSAVPVKFSLGGDRGLAVLDGAPAVRTVACNAEDPSDAVEEVAAESQSGLTYDAVADRYQYVWKTSKDWSGSCRRLDVRLVDGSVRSAVFRMR